MPWQDNSGKGGGKGPVRGPWGQPPKQPGGGNGRGPGKGSEPPDLDELLRASKQRLKRAFPRGAGAKPPEFNRRTGILAAVGIGVLWLLSGFYQVAASELAVVTTFGKFDRVAGPGLHWHMPFPFERARKAQVTEVRGTLVPQGEQRGDRSPGLMLTGDKNIVDVGLNVQWRIKPDASAQEGQLPPVAQFIFMIEEPETFVRALAEASIREVVGRNELDFIQTEGRGVIGQETRELMQQTLDAQATGIEIVEVNFTKADPPTEEVNQAFLDVIAAAQDREQYINTARAYANKVIPEARGQAQKILEDARAYQAQVTADARGQASRFNAILEEYQKAPEVTRQRMYLETAERVLAPMNKVIIEDDAASGVVPYLPLGELNRKGATQ